MKDPILPLRTAYFQKLSGLGLSVYEEGAVPDAAAKPFVVISTISADEESNQSDFGHEVSVTLDIVTASPRNAGGSSKAADQIAGQILAAVNSKTKFVINADFQSVTVRKDIDTKNTAVSDTEKIFRRILRLNHKIKQVQ